MKKIKIVLIVICAFLLCSCTKTKELVSSEKFVSVLKKYNINVLEDTKDDYADKSYYYVQDKTKIYYVDANNKNTINGIFMDETNNILSYKETLSDSSVLSGPNWASLSLDTKETYYFVGLIEDTYIKVESDIKDKGLMLKIIRELGF